ncbi:MAG: TonB family protein [Steroidobacteraceae bacterium]|nr:TonB family protein [Steroidobacteraceae bacterium]
MNAAALLLWTLVTSPAVSAEAGSASDTAEARNAFGLACKMPSTQLAIPDGSKATETEMRQAQDAFREFDASVTAYSTCLARELSRQLEARPEDRESLESIRADLNDAAIAEAERLAAEINWAVRAYRSRGQVPPRLRGLPDERVQERCYPRSIERMDVRVYVMVAATGAVEQIEMPPNLTEEMRAAVRCIVGSLQLDPATRDGRAEASWVTLPIRFARPEDDLNATLQPARLLTGEPDLAKAMGHCRSAKMKEGGDVKLSLTVSKKGRVVGAQVAVSSGSRKVDDVARCLTRWLRYEPAVYRGQRVDVKMVWWTVTIPPQP